MRAVNWRKDGSGGSRIGGTGKFSLQVGEKVEMQI